MKCKLRAVKMHRLTLDGSQMNGCFLIKCGTFVIVLKLIVTYVFFLFVFDAGYRWSTHFFIRSHTQRKSFANFLSSRYVD